MLLLLTRMRLAVVRVLDPSAMTYEELYQKIVEVRLVIDELMSDYFQLHCAAARLDGECLPAQVHLTEFMTVCAWQSFNERGQRGGDVRIMLRDGSLPLYVARGMLSSAMEQVNTISVCNCKEEDGDS